MSEYVATFRTHFSALASRRKLEAAGVAARMAPVPRELSSSCGVCLFYSGDGPMTELLHRDMERVYLMADDGYTPVAENE